MNGDEPVDRLKSADAAGDCRSATNAPGKGRVFAVCVSERKGTAKTARKSVRLRAGHGVEGDAHAGPWHRQVSLLALRDIEYMKSRGADVESGSFGENIVTEGIELGNLEPGVLLRCGRVLLRVTQIGKECHTMCAIGRAVGECIMPTRGVFCEVVEGGEIEPGQEIEVMND